MIVCTEKDEEFLKEVYDIFKDNTDKIKKEIALGVYSYYIKLSPFRMIEIEENNAIYRRYYEVKLYNFLKCYSVSIGSIGVDGTVVPYTTMFKGYMDIVKEVEQRIKEKKEQKRYNKRVKNISKATEIIKKYRSL